MTRSDLSETPEFSEEIGTERKTYPLPAVDGSRVMCVANTKQLYEQLLAACRTADKAEETDHAILSETYTAPFLPEGEYVVRAKVSNWIAGVMEQGQYKPLQSVDLSIRKKETGYRGPVSLHVAVNPQYPGMVMCSTRDDHPLLYGTGTKVMVNTTGVQTPEESLDRADHLFQHLIDQGLDDEEINGDSKLFSQLEVYHRIPLARYMESCETAKDSENIIPIDKHHRIEGVGHDDIPNTYKDFQFRSGRWADLGFSQLRPMSLKIYRTYTDTDSEVLRQPKFEASWGKVSGSTHLPFEKWDELRSQLSALLCSHLLWAGIGAEEVKSDDVSRGRTASRFTWNHPQNRREELREYYTTKASRLTRAISSQPQSFVDVLSEVVHSPGATYDQLADEVPWSRRTVERRITDLVDAGLVSKIRSSCVLIEPKSRAILPMLASAVKMERLTPHKLAEETDEDSQHVVEETVRDIVDGIDCPLDRKQANRTYEWLVEQLEETGERFKHFFRRDR